MNFHFIPSSSSLSSLQNNDENLNVSLSTSQFNGQQQSVPTTYHEMNDQVKQIFVQWLFGMNFPYAIKNWCV